MNDRFSNLETPAETPGRLTAPAILLAEDDDGHVELIRELLRDAGLRHPVVRLRDGQEVLDYLSAGQHSSTLTPAPLLLLLDIRMPKVDGVEVLCHLKRHARWSRLPVVMLTTTDDPREMEKCYGLGCDGYVTKPVDVARFAEVVRQLGCFAPASEARAGPGAALAGQTLS